MPSRLRDLASRARVGRRQNNQDDNLSEFDTFDEPSLSPASSNDHTMGGSASGHGHNAPMQQVEYQDQLLIPPNLPFSEVTGGQYTGSQESQHSSYADLAALRERNRESRPASLSLSVNYVPTKFTKLHAQGDWAHRRAKQGGGRDAFAANAPRMGDLGTVDDDEGLVFQVGKGGLKAKHKPKLRWNRFKWILFVANSVAFIYGLATLVCAILVWINVFFQSDVIRVGNRTELILSTIAATLIVFTSLLGFSGILLNNRAFLAVYVLLLWICLAFMVAPGYIAYKKKTFNLEGKINLQWSRSLGTVGRLRIQDALKCCGYFSPQIEATVSALCYPRSNEDGCKNRYMKLERTVLRTWYTISFSLVPGHILVILAGLLCSNHITYRFGKGLTPKRYRLDVDTMAVIMNDYASQIAEQYGPDVANEAMTRSSLHLNESSRPSSRRGSQSGGLSPGMNPAASTLKNRYNVAQAEGSGRYDSPFEDSAQATRYTDNDSYDGHNSSQYHGNAQRSPTRNNFGFAQ